MVPLKWVKRIEARSDRVLHYHSYLAEYVVLEVDVQVRDCGVKILLIVREADFVAELMLSVVVWFLLHSVVGEMDILIKVIQLELTSTCAQVAVEIVIAL